MSRDRYRLGYLREDKLPVGVHNFKISPLFKGERPRYVQAANLREAAEANFGDQIAASFMQGNSLYVTINSGTKYVVIREVF